MLQTRTCFIFTRVKDLGVTIYAGVYNMLPISHHELRPTWSDRLADDLLQNLYEGSRAPK